MPPLPSVLTHVLASGFTAFQSTLHSYLKLTTVLLNIFHGFYARFPVFPSGEHRLGLELRGFLALGCPVAFHQWEALVGWKEVEMKVFNPDNLSATSPWGWLSSFRKGHVESFSMQPTSQIPVTSAFPGHFGPCRVVTLCYCCPWVLAYFLLVFLMLPTSL